MKNSPGFTRSLPEVRKDGDKLATIQGLGACYYREGDAGTEYWLWDDVVERIRPGAFDGAIADGSDVRSFFNHNPDRILGRTTAGTLTLALTADGLTYTVTPPDTEEGRATLTAVERRDVTGSSFMFLPVRTTWEEIKREGEPRIYVRWLDEVATFEVGPVAFPAYTATTAEASRDTSGAAIANRYQQWLANHVRSAREDWSRRFSGKPDTGRRSREALAVEVDLFFRRAT